MQGHRRLQTYLALLGITYLSAALGFMLAERMTPLDALYFTMATFMTVGYGDIAPTTPIGKALVMIVTPTALVLIFGIGINLAQDYFREILSGRSHRMDRYLSSLSGHFVVCGYGRLGTIVVSELLRTDEKVVVIDKLEEKGARLEEMGVPFVAGNALDEAVLDRAGLKRAKGIVTTFEEDADNIYVVLEAVEMNAHAEIVSAATNAVSARKLYLAGASRVVSPMLLGGEMLARSATDPGFEGVVPDGRVKKCAPTVCSGD